LLATRALRWVSSVPSLSDLSGLFFSVFFPEQPIMQVFDFGILEKDLLLQGLDLDFPRAC
jgi:hypothetical protein